MYIRGTDFTFISTSFRSHFPIPTEWCFIIIIIIIIIIISKCLLIFQTIEQAGVKMSYEMDRQWTNKIVKIGFIYFCIYLLQCHINTNLIKDIKVNVLFSIKI